LFSQQKVGQGWKPRVNPWIIAGTVALAAFMEVLDTSIANVGEDLQVAKQQLEVSRQNLDLAAETLTQSLDRFQAGVMDSVEVVQSQETVDSANRDYVSSLFSLNLARTSLAKATGQAEKFIPNMLVKGN
jgi:hypothetical protein